MPYKAWILAPEGRGTAADRERLAEAFVSLHPDLRPANAGSCLVSDDGHVTDETIVRVLNELEQFDGKRLVWIVGSVKAGPLGQRFICTDSFEPKITVDALWLALNSAAEKQPHAPLIAVVDVCHAAPPRHITLHEQMVAFAASKSEERAFADDSGGWLTQHLLNRILQGPPGPVTISSLEDSLARAREAEGHAMQRPIVHAGRHKLLALNELVSTTAASPQKRSTLPSVEALRTRYRKWETRHVAVRGLPAVRDGFHGIDPLARPIEVGETKEPRDAAGRERRILDFVEQHQHLVLVGAPGSGKTTTLQFIAWSTASSLLDGTAPKTTYPIYVALNRCGPEQGRSLRELVLGEAPCDSWETLLRGDFLLLLDGLNEVRRDYQSSVSRDLRDLIDSSSRARCTLTMRPGSWYGQFDCPACELLPFGPEQIEAFLIQNLGDQDRAQQLLDVLRLRPRIWSWVRNPLTLAMVTRVTMEAGGHLPENLGRLVRTFVRGWLTRERVQNPDQTSLRLKERLLGKLAYAGRSRGQVAISRSLAIDTVSRDLVSLRERDKSSIGFIDEVIDNHLVELREDELIFAHEVYQEYFAAHELLARASEDPSLPERLAEESFWEGPLVLFSGLSALRDDVIRRLASRAPLVAARSVTSSISEEPALAQAVAQEALRVGSESGGRPRSESLLALSELGAIELLQSLLKRSGTGRGARNAVATAVRTARLDEALPLIEALLGQPDKKSLLYSALAAIGDNEEQLDDMVRDRALSLIPSLQRQLPNPRWWVQFARSFGLVGRSLSVKGAITRLGRTKKRRDVGLTLAVELAIEHELLHDVPVDRWLMELCSLPPSGPKAAFRLSQRLGLLQDEVANEVLSQVQRGSAKLSKSISSFATEFDQSPVEVKEMLVDALFVNGKPRAVTTASDLVLRWDLQSIFPPPKVVGLLLAHGRRSSIRLALVLVFECGLVGELDFKTIVAQLEARTNDKGVRALLASEPVRWEDLHPRKLGNLGNWSRAAATWYSYMVPRAGNSAAGHSKSQQPQQHESVHDITRKRASPKKARKKTPRRTKVAERRPDPPRLSVSLGELLPDLRHFKNDPD